jgi:hypothetical protein
VLDGLPLSCWPRGGVWPDAAHKEFAEGREVERRGVVSLNGMLLQRPHRSADGGGGGTQ